MKNWLLWLIVGLISILGGVLALTNPLKASLTAEQFAAWAFLLAGVLQMFSAWKAAGWGAKIWAAVVGAAGLFVGISLLSHPLSGLLSLTLLVAILFFVTGLAKIMVSFSLRSTPTFLPVLISGIISVILAVMIFSNFPASAITILGVLLAIELISNGISLVALALHRKSVA